jgi:inosine-uridine nucleoside N-ribohydrolase
MTSSAQPVSIIFDTDMQTDSDDAAALAVLHQLADRGEARILATPVCVLNPWSAPCTEAINTYYGRPDIPVGTLKGTDGVEKTSKYTQHIAENFPHPTKKTEDFPDALTVYRQVLADAPDHSVVILSVGYMTNLASLLNSPPDAISPLSGAELIRTKVEKWVCMGGNFPDDFKKTGPSDNVNFRRHPASVIECVNGWPGPIVFVGREIGHAMRAGARLQETPKTNPVRVAYERHRGAGKDNHCADIAAVLYAVRGLEDHWELMEDGGMEFTSDESHFRWDSSSTRNHSYLLEQKDPEIIQEILEDFMSQPPRSSE